MTEEQIREKKYNEENELENEKLDLRSMINSILTYQDASLSELRANRYIKDYESKMPLDIFQEVIKEQYEYFKNHAIVHENVYTDSEGITYNNVVWK